MKLLDLHKVQYFAAVARHGSFGQAAFSLGLSQPALTRQIQALEASLGVVLLERGGRTTKPTEAGARLLERSPDLIRLVREIQVEVEDLASAPVGVVSLAVLTSFSAAYSSQLLNRFSQIFPDLRVSLTEGTSHYVEERLFAGQADIGIFIGNTRSEKLIVEDLMAEEFQLFGGERVTAQPVWSLAQIAGLPLVIPPAPHGTRRLIDDAARRVGVTLRPKFEVDSPYLIRELILSGDVYAILPSSSVPEEVASGRLHTARIEKAPRRTVVLGTLRGEPLSAAARALAQDIRRAVLSRGEASI